MTFDILDSSIILSFFNFTETSPFMDQFNELGYKDLNSIFNLATIFYFMPLYITLVFAYYPLILFKNKSKM